MNRPKEGSIRNLQFVRWRVFFLVSGMEHGVPTWYTVGGYLPYLPFWEIRRFRDSSGRCDRQAQMLVAGEMGKNSLRA